MKSIDNEVGRPSIRLVCDILSEISVAQVLRL